MLLIIYWLGLMTLLNTPYVLSNFDATDNFEWRVVNDGVMGGLSQSSIAQTDSGTAVFSGQISLENNGGFASIRLPFQTVNCQKFSKFVLRVKGDGKRYQFRAKQNQRDYQSYVAYFDTDEEWQDIEIPFELLYPSFRGRKLDMPTFAGKQLSEIGLLIGNKTAESFEIEMDWMQLK